MSIVIGVDIGGTSVKAGIVRLDGVVLSKCSGACPVEPMDRSPQAIVETLARVVQRALEQSKLARSEVVGVGVACPGQLLDGGVIHGAAAFPTWNDVPLKDMIEDSLEMKVDGTAVVAEVTVCNDADAAIIAEQWVGSAKDNVQNFIMITLGTGVGCGLMVDGKLVRGATNFIEGGHMLVEKNGRLCGCSQRGCLEAYCSATALVKEAERRLDTGADSKLTSYPREQITAKLVFDLATTDVDALCVQVIEEAADYLGFALVSLCRILDPEMIVLAGGLAEAGEFFIDQVRTAFKKHTWTKFPNPTRIEKATAGYDSGIIGAAATATNIRA